VLVCDKLEAAHEPDTEEIQDNMRYVYVEPQVQLGGEYELFLPGADIS